MDFNGDKSGNSIDTRDKITYNLNEFECLEVRKQDQCMRWDHIPSKWIQMIKSKNTASMHDTRSHTSWLDFNGEKSENSINARDKITYSLNEYQCIQVGKQHECMRWDHIPCKWNHMITSQNIASIHDTRSHTSWMMSNDYMSEYSTNAWCKITYMLNESRWLQVRKQRQCKR